MSNIFHYRNRLLLALPASELRFFSNRLERVPAPRRRQLELPDKPITHVYFIESGIASIVAQPGRANEAEVGIIGREGLIGLAALLGDGRSPYSTYMQVGGDALRMEAEAFALALKRCPAARRIFLAFAQSFLTQVSETAASNARVTVDSRLARWLLMAQDRVDGDEILLTHEFLSLIIGARRAGVTEGIHELTRRGLILLRAGSSPLSTGKGLKSMRATLTEPRNRNMRV